MFPFTNLMNISDPEQLLKLDLGGFENQPFHFYWKDVEGKYLGCNNTQALATGFESGSDLLGSTDLDIFPTTFAPIYRQNDLAVIHKDQPSVVIEPGTSLAGNPIFGFSYKTPLRMRANKKVIGIIGVSFVYQANEALNQLSINQSASSDNVHLTDRQIDCLYYAVKGLTMKRIANELNLSPKTIEHYLCAIKAKLNCRNRSELIAKGLQLSCIKYKLSLGK